MKKFGLFCLVALFSAVIFASKVATQPSPELPLWLVYQQSLKEAKYVDLTHTITPSIPVWTGFGPSTFEQNSAAHPTLLPR